MRGFFALAFVIGALGLAAQDAVQGVGEAGGQPQAAALVLDVRGAITPATSDYIIRGLDEATARGAPLVVLQMDTPGGLATSMREIISAILASPVPVASFVAPSGARAASAGTYMMYASHVAAMAPATNLGAATPVAIGGGGGGDDQTPFGQPISEDDDAEEPPEGPFNASEAKAINDSVAYIRGLAELRGRNADWAERAVRRAESLSSREAAEAGVIDFVANDLDDMLRQADGMTVTTSAGDVTLQTAGLPVENIEPGWRTQVLSILTDPNVALILMLIGFYGLVFEFLNPGVLVPGTLGGISLLLGLYALALLPLNYAGAGLILLGLALIVAEAFAPSFGILGIGGTVALVLGATMLVDTDDVPGLEVSLPLIAAVAVAGLASTLLVARLATKSFKMRIVSGREDMIGALGKVMDWQDGAGHVWLHGERWRATGATGLLAGDVVRVTALEGLVLAVEPAAGGEETAFPA
jgi:membrane-bound serine protease (ClpP class)